MTYVVTSMAEAQAIGLCWLARQPGLPDVHVIRASVAQLHSTPCGWCDYPTDELMRMLEYRTVGYSSPDAMHPVIGPREREWWSMGGKARLAAIELASGREAAA